MARPLKSSGQTLALGLSISTFGGSMSFSFRQALNAVDLHLSRAARQLLYTVPGIAGAMVVRQSRQDERAHADGAFGD
jgi:hypothetical protein